VQDMAAQYGLSLSEWRFETRPLNVVSDQVRTVA